MPFHIHIYETSDLIKSYLFFGLFNMIVFVIFFSLIDSLRSFDCFIHSFSIVSSGSSNPNIPSTILPDKFFDATNNLFLLFVLLKNRIISCPPKLHATFVFLICQCFPVLVVLIREITSCKSSSLNRRYLLWQNVTTTTIDVLAALPNLNDIL